ncbi:MAG: UDP-N-acetylmuramate dehydrogenase, partial [Chloroflexota bacterium]|nr:UDP-N-acetylmuramate dehydrogenase [Chloroflexota bacterium]
MNPERNVPLAPHTSLRVGGPADYLLVAHSEAEMVDGLRWARDQGVPVRVIGGGSNLLVADAGVDGLVIKAVTSHFEVDGEVVTARAGVTIASMARKLAKRGLSGLEWAANVPGTVGGAVVNNAGAFGGETAACVIEATIVNAEGQLRTLDQAELGYAYRTSVLKRGELGEVAVVQARWRARHSTPEEADGNVRHFNAQRMRSQPRILSAGSVFANPEGLFAGKLIDEAGLKGATIGGARISEQHANFIVNPGG